MFVLIHSPLVGPLTWQPVAKELEQRGVETIVPSLRENEVAGLPYWQQQVQAVERALAAVPFDQSLVLVAHSGGGMLLPAIRQATKRPISAYLFVDAGIPENGKSRLDLFEDDEAIVGFRQAAVDGMLPVWSEADLVEMIPDPDLRRHFVAELRPLPLRVYEEPIPVFEAWPDAPCGYIRFGKNFAYDAPAVRAQAEGWPFLHLNGAHFQMLVDPAEVAQALLQIYTSCIGENPQRL